jgi:hypothetical protein
MDAALENRLFRPVAMDIAMWHAGPAAELLRPGLRDIELPRVSADKLRKAFDLLLMASGKGNYLKEKFRNEVLGAVAFAAPGTAYFGLWTTAAATDHSASHGGTAGEVASSGAYDRVAKTNNTTNFATITGAAAKVNSNAITWAAATANWNSSNVIPQLLVLDGNAKTSADNLLVWADFAVAKAILLGDTPQINTSAFSWTEA